MAGMTTEASGAGGFHGSIPASAAVLEDTSLGADAEPPASTGAESADGASVAVGAVHPVMANANKAAAQVWASA